MKLFHTFCLGLGMLLASVSAPALERTTHNDIQNLNNGVEKRLEATRAAFTALLNELKAQIDDILARLGILETDMAAVKAKNTEQDTTINVIRARQPVDWNTPLEQRLNAMAARLQTLENKPTGGNISWTSCTAHSFDGYSGPSYQTCPSGSFMHGFSQGGLNTGRKVYHGTIYCCKPVIQ